jgi:inorganic triphosphatase YgiF
MRDEFELKLLLAPAQAERLLRSAAVRALSHGARPSTARLTTRYFDTPDHELKARDIALRVREDGDRRVQTVKLPGKGGNGLQHYKEIEAEIATSTPDLDAIKGKQTRIGRGCGLACPHFHNGVHAQGPTAAFRRRRDRAGGR